MLRANARTQQQVLQTHSDDAGRDLYGRPDLTGDGPVNFNDSLGLRPRALLQSCEIDQFLDDDTQIGDH